MPVDSERDVVSEKRIKKPKHEINWVDSHVNTFYYVNHNNRKKKKCHYVHVNKVWSPSSSLTFYLRSCIIFCLTVIFWATSPSLSRSGVIWHLIYMCHAFTFSFAVLSDTAAHRLKTSPMTITSSISIYFLIRFICLSLSPSLSQPVCHSLSLFLSHIFGCLTPHTPFASLVSRTLATRTVMSSMRSWILQLWPPLPAHEALLSLALGILSSMQPSSLAHTSACHYRPFPSDFGLKVHRLMHSFSPVHPPLHMHRPPFYYAPHGSLVYLPLQVSAVFLISPSLLRQKVGSRLRIFSGCYFHSTRHERCAALWRNRDTMKPKSSLQFLRAIIRSAV